MKLKLISTALLLVVSGNLLSQCPSRVQFAGTLYGIENSRAPDAVVLKELRRLYDRYTECRAPQDSLYARIVHRLGNFYRLTGNVEKGIRFTKEAISINSGPGNATDKAFLVNSYFNLGLCYWQENLYAEAQYYFDSCIYLGTRYPAKYNVLFMAFEKKAYSFFQTGDYQKSVETAEKGILFAMKAKDSLFEATLLSQKAQSELELNEDSAAGKDIKRSIHILANNNEGQYYLAAAYSIYAGFLIRQHQYEAAIAYYERSFALNKKNNEWAQCARDMHDLGYLYDNILHNAPQAIECYRKGIEIIQRTDETPELLGLYINMGVVYWRKKDYREALLYYQKGLNVLPVNFTDTDIAHNPSVEMLKLAGNAYYAAALLANKADALLDEYSVAGRKELLSVALSTYELADRAIDIMRWKQNGEQSKLFWRRKTKIMYEHAIEVCYLLKNIDKALFFFEKSRAVLLNDKLSELGAKRFIAAPDRNREQELNIKISSLNQELSVLSEGAVSFNTIRQELLSAQDELEKFIKNLEKKYPAYYKYKYDNAVYPLNVVRDKLLAGNQSLVEYFTGDSSVYMLALSHSGSSFLKISQKGCSDLSRELMQLCSDRTLLNQQYRRYRSLAFSYYEKLFKPLKIPPGRVIISPDENFIPFEALLSDAADPTSFLVKQYAFSYAYSVGLIMRNVSVTPEGNSFLGVAPVSYRQYLNQQPLEGADQSLQSIRPYFQQAKFLINQQATKEQFIKDLQRYNIIQVYSHADADSSGMPPVLYLSDSFITIPEIQSLDDLRAGMIVLSACRTGVGKNAKGEGIFSLARAFTAAGISSTVTTLWQIDNKATYQLTEGFYKYLSAGLPKDVALQKAKLEFLQNNDKTYELPYFWAANILLGKTDVIKKKSSYTALPFLLVISVLLSATAVIVIKSAIRRRLHGNSKKTVLPGT